MIYQILFYRLKPLLMCFYGRDRLFICSKSCLKHRRHIATEAYLDEPCLDVLIVQKLRKDKEFLAQELISEIDGRVHDSRAVCSDGVGNVTDVDGVQVFVV